MGCLLIFVCVVASECCGYGTKVIAEHELVVRDARAFERALVARLNHRLAVWRVATAWPGDGDRHKLGSRLRVCI